MASVSENVFFIRNLLGISQQQMADYLHISKETYGKTEREETELTVDRLIKISACFGLSVSQVIDFDQDRFKENFRLNFNLFVKK
jgi:transcriptional regulator with XRE-family HTH domain